MPDLRTLLTLIEPLQPEIVKVDIEGAEWELFNQTDTQMRDWLAKGPTKQLAIEFHDRFLPKASQHTARQAVVQMLKRCGFHHRHTSPSGEENLFVRAHSVASC